MEIIRIIFRLPFICGKECYRKHKSREVQRGEHD